jgi:hypothetical protein
MKLFTFGCSLTQFVGIKEKLSSLIGVDYIDSAQAAGSNQLQINKFNELVLKNKIDKNDVIYWQITFMYRRYKRLMINYLDIIDDIQNTKHKYQGKHYIMNSSNIFDHTPRIDLMSNSPWFDSNSDESETDFNQDLQTLLSTIILAKKITKNIIIVFGWDDVMPLEFLTIFKKYLDKHNIKYVDKSYLTFVNENNLDYMDEIHPTKKSAEIFVETMVYPLLKEILRNENQTV